ncbi:MAG TPA: methyltransferase domain-containing protein [Phycisphaerae bacterium]|nr:methyltransferase domain-containing protein [Phycisphaerae bacterium]HRW53739.1 methyltransferase domain-containing protein [Phycisphaerae bacterium]
MPRALNRLCDLRIPLIAILATTFSGACAKPEQSVKPGINSKFKSDINVDEWVQRFESESREVFHHRDLILDAMNLTPRECVADIGAGTGFYTIAFAERVRPGGLVFAVDIAEPFLRHIRDFAAERGLENITTIQCPDNTTGLHANSVDVAFICDTYHHFEYPKSTIASLYRAMRKGGRVHIIEFIRHDADGGRDDAKWMAMPTERREWVIGHVRCDRDTVIRECESAGFVVAEAQADDVNRALSENYMLTLIKP